jgi:hypothetical protein
MCLISVIDTDWRKQNIHIFDWFLDGIFVVGLGSCSYSNREKRRQGKAIRVIVQNMKGFEEANLAKRI